MHVTKGESPLPVRHASILEMPDPGPLRQRLESLYVRLNRPEYIEPDPLQFVVRYPRLEDREIMGMIAACLAFGNVKQIIRSIATVEALLPSPYECVLSSSEAELSRRLEGFRHRFVAGIDLAELLSGIRAVNVRHGSLGAAFRATMGEHDQTVLPGLARFVNELRQGVGRKRNYLLPDPAAGSACKRLQLFLRWMVRRDAVDPGGWDFVPPAKLVVPLDTHLHRIARALRLTQRRQADARTALEVTAAFRTIAPEDPVRYDFALTRLGIRSDTDLTAFLDGEEQTADGPLSPVKI